MNTFNNDTSIHDDNYPTCGFYHWSIFDFKLSLNKSKPKLEFDWSEHDQDNLKGAFAIGYSLALIPSGRASEIYGGKVVALTGGIIHTSLNLVTPWAARRSIWLLLIIRIVIGAAAASLIPAFYYFIVHWIPVNEKSKALAALNLGNSLGNICINLISGYLCQYGFDGGWPTVFYTTASNYPSEHCWITRHELLLIGVQGELRPSPPPVGLKLYIRMLLSIPVLAAICVKLAHSWFYTMLQNKIPQYMVAVLACFGMFLSLLYITQSECNRMLFVSLMATVVASAGISTGGSSTIIFDMTTAYSASLIAIISTISMVFAFGTPHLITAILNDCSNSIAAWKNVFYVSACIIASCGLVFVLFASAENQRWEIDQQIYTDNSSDSTTQDSNCK
ncbi:hypothetical protein RDWZM_005632 [Blomia tropicalis]|uniref:Uncharacterized protein n=1 Tax=Blomia tropicalis TaxID=40697 RepID=A0A9Q0RMT2_BLOTA|nr:hypothetical protein RDWZM_005632 [Blomia tropicalis]